MIVVETLHGVKQLLKPIVVGLLALASCGGDKGEPKVIGSLDLKSPGGLKIVDLGNGSIQLQWQTVNNEDDFEGYNIYGAKGNATTLGVVEGQPLELLDIAGEPLAATKTILTNFSYALANADYGLPSYNSNTETEYELDELKFPALPYHKTNAANGEPNLPTCKPGIASANTTAEQNANVCVGLGASKEETSASNITSNGVVTYTFPETLTVGTEYCFLVFSVQDEGEEISQASSNVECITPRWKVTGDAANSNSQRLVVNGGYRAYRTACATAGTCQSLAWQTKSPSGFGADETEPFGFENFTSNNWVIAGQNAGLKYMGYFPNGFSDQDFINLVGAPPTYKVDVSATPLEHNGYSLEGQSVPLLAKGIYALAIGDKADAAGASGFYYDWLYISAVNGTTYSYELRLSNKLETVATE